ncbi:hypothetical protein SHPE106448_04025 [Shewanella pealeana]
MMLNQENKNTFFNLPLKLTGNTPYPIGVAEVRWNKLRDADRDVGVAFAGQDAPSEALAIYP